MVRGRVHVPVALGALLLIVCSICLARSPQILHAQAYQWEDKEGTVHLTDDPSKIPKGMKDKVEVMPMESPRPGSGTQSPAVSEEESGDAESEDTSSGQSPESSGGLDQEVGKWQKKLDEDRAYLEELNLSIQHTHTALKRNQLQRERARVKNQIREDEKMVGQAIPSEATEGDTD